VPSAIACRPGTAAIGIFFTVIIAGSFTVGLMGLRQTARVQAEALAAQLACAMIGQDRRGAAGKAFL